MISNKSEEVSALGGRTALEGARSVAAGDI